MKAYGSSRIAGGRVQQILNWPGSFETFRKVRILSHSLRLFADAQADPDMPSVRRAGKDSGMGFGS